MCSGAESASLAAQAFLEAMGNGPLLPLAQQLDCAIGAANVAVWRRLRGEGGSTLTAVAIVADCKVLCVHVGDSRLYAGDESLSQVTTDDTLGGLLGCDDPEFVGSGLLMQFVGMGEAMLHQSFDLSSPLPAKLMLSTDGAHSLSWLTLNQLFDPDETEFDRFASGPGSDDNATAILVDVAAAVRAAGVAGTTDPSICVTSTFGRAIIDP